MLQGAAGLAVMAAIGAGTPVTARAQAPAAEARIEIPGGPLGTALARLGQQAGLVIAVDPALVRDQRTASLSGSYGPAAALERLLAGSGLRAEADGQGGFRVVAAPAPAAAGP